MAGPGRRGTGRGPCRRASSTTTSGRKNFLVDRENQVKLIDFGLAIPNTPAFRGPGNRTGTLQYMAPELIRREPIDERIDIFAFGAMAFEFLTGRLPYDADELDGHDAPAHQPEPLDPAMVKPKLSDELCDVLRKLTARKERPMAVDGHLAETLRSIPAKRPEAVVSATWIASTRVRSAGWPG